MRNHKPGEAMPSERVKALILDYEQVYNRMVTGLARERGSLTGVPTGQPVIQRAQHLHSALRDWYHRSLLAEGIADPEEYPG